MKKDNLELMNKISFAIKRNDDFIIELNKKTKTTNKDLMAAITAVNDNLQKYQQLDNLLYKGELKWR